MAVVNLGIFGFVLLAIAAMVMLCIIVWDAARGREREAIAKLIEREVIGGKDAARKAFDRRRVDVTLEAVLAALELQKGSQQWQRDGGRYVPHPATWLNQGRWQDEVDTSGNGLSKDEWEQAAEIRRKSYGRCPHEQPCANYDECVTTIGLARRSGAA